MCYLVESREDLVNTLFTFQHLLSFSHFFSFLFREHCVPSFLSRNPIHPSTTTLSCSNCPCTKRVILGLVWRTRFSLLLLPQSLHRRRKVPLLLFRFVYLYLLLPALFATERRVPSIHEDVPIVPERFFAEEAGGEEVRRVILESGGSRGGNGEAPLSEGGGVTHGHGPGEEIVGTVMTRVHLVV